MLPATRRCLPAASSCALGSSVTSYSLQTNSHKLSLLVALTEYLLSQTHFLFGNCAPPDAMYPGVFYLQLVALTTEIRALGGYKGLTCDYCLCANLIDL